MSNATQSESQQLEGLKGRRLGPYLSHNPVSATQIWQWCLAMGEKNPHYRPGKNQIAPPAMMQMWTMRDIDDRYAFGSTDAKPYRVFEDMRVLGYPANVAVSYNINFHRYLKVGERAMHFSSVVDISEKKSTRLGTGYFVSERVEYLTVDEIIFAEAVITYFQYKPAEARSGGDDRVESSIAARGPYDDVTMESDNGRQPGFPSIDPSRMGVGDLLPELRIPITHKLIVGGAIATQDFIPVHHNASAAQAAGMSDIFMNILTTCGLSARYLSDWAGVGNRLKTIKFNLRAPNFPGDVMVMGGEVTRIEVEPKGALVSVAFKGRNRLGYHTSGEATLGLPNLNTTS